MLYAVRPSLLLALGACGLHLGLAALDGKEHERVVGDPRMSPSFRLGSGAVATTPAHQSIKSWTDPVEVARLKQDQSPPDTTGGSFLPAPGKNHEPTPIFRKIQNLPC